MRLILVCLVILPLSVFTQKQDISLEDAVMQQYRKFAPTSLNGCQGLEGTNDLIYWSDRYDTIYRVDIKNQNKTIFLTTETINKNLGESGLRHLYGVHVPNNNEVVFNNDNKYYNFNIKSGEIKEILTYPKISENIHYDLASNQLAYTVGNNVRLSTSEKTELKATDFTDPNIVSGQSIARNEFGISEGLFWSPNGQHLAFYQKNETEVGDYPLLDITSTPGKLKNIKYPMAGSRSEQAKVGVYNVKTQSTIYLSIEGEKEQYLTNLGWGPEGKYIYLAVLNRGQNHMKLQKYNAGTGQLEKTLFEEKNDKYVEPERPVWFIPGTNDFLWFSERDGFDHLYRYSTDGKLVSQLTKGNWEVEAILGLDATKKFVIIETTDETGLNRYYRKVELSSGKTTILTKTPGVHHASLHPNGQYLIDHYSNLTTPGVQQVLDMNGKIVSTLHQSENPYTDVNIGTTELVEITGEDGTILNGRIIKPGNFNESEKYPVLVYVYGGPHAQMVTNSWMAGASLWMHYMAEKGYIIFTLDNRGSANRGLKFENVIHRQLGTVEMEDQLAGVEYLKSLPYVDSDRMAVHGWSFGGFMTTSLMLRHPGVFKVGVAGGPVTDWKYYEIMYGERYMDTPEENPEGYKNSALTTYASNLKGDLLLIHGTVDDVVVMQHNLSLIKKFIDEGILVDFFPYPNHPHNVRGKDRVHLMNKVLTYIEKNLE